MNKTLSKAVLTIIFSLASLSANAEYTFRLLDSLGGTYSRATSINNSGQIVGNSNTAGDSNSPAVIWNWNGSIATNLSSQGEVFSFALGINSSGQVIGNSYPLYGPAIPKLWSELGVTGFSSSSLGGNYAYVNAINDSGQVVGTANVEPNGFKHATIWNGTVATDLGTLGGFESRANAINNLGQVVGDSLLNGNNYDYHATIWNGTVATDLGTLGGLGSRANDINNSGQVVGNSLLNGNDYNTSTATLWDGNTATNLGTINGFNTSDALAINSQGQIVGFSRIGTQDHATLWINGNAIDLNIFLNISDKNAGWALVEARDVNDNGLIVGTATNSISGISQAFVLTPVPEADTSAMLLMGAGVMGFMARRRKNAQA